MSRCEHYTPYIYIYVQIYNYIDTFRFDAFTGNDAHTKGELALREKFAKECNVTFMCRAPGGWSAWGQPCDAVHAEFSSDLNFLLADVYIYIYMYIYIYCIYMILCVGTLSCGSIYIQ